MQANLTPLLVWALAAGLVGLGSHYRVAGEMVLFGAMSLGISLVLWRHGFQGDWEAPLLRIPFLLVAAYLFSAELNDALAWGLRLGNWEWFNPWGILLVVVVEGVAWCQSKLHPNLGRDIGETN
jgi:hypothetical protein